MTLPSWNGASTNGGGEVTIAPAFLEKKLSIAAILSSPQPIVFKDEPGGAEFLKTPRNFISWTFVDVSEVPVTPDDGLITFDVKTRANPEFAEDIPRGTNVDATAIPFSLAFASPPTEIIVSGSSITIATDVIVRVSGSI